MMSSNHKPVGQRHNKTWLAVGVLMVIGLMIWFAGTSLAATNNATENTTNNAVTFDLDKLQAEVDDTSGLTERLNDVEEKRSKELDKINGDFEKAYTKIMDNDKLTADQKEKLLKNELRKKKQRTDQANKSADRDKSLADGTWKAQHRSASRVVSTYQSGGYWEPPVSSGGGGSSSAGASKPLVLPCVDTSSLKPKLPGTTMPLTQATTATTR
jgi:Skp family chaperone for outer membrane proteins